MVGAEFRKKLSELLLDESIEIEISPVMGESSRANWKRPAKLEFYVPDEWVKNINGFETLVDGYLAVRVPREEIVKDKEDPQIELNFRKEDEVGISDNTEI